MTKPADQINWGKVRDLVERYELIQGLINTFGVLPHNDGSHMLAAIIQALITELDGVQPASIVTPIPV